jgi:hypothetical protein
MASQVLKMILKISIYITYIVRVYILDPAALATSSQALSVFLAVWRRGAGHVTYIDKNIKIYYPIILLIIVDYKE